MKIGVLTGGGDAPGLNPAIAGVVERATMFGHEVVGLKRGWEALAIRTNDRHVVKLGPEVIRDYARLAGTRLQSSRTNPVAPENDRSDVVLDNVRKLGLDGVIAMGGEDTLGAAATLHDRGLKVVGIPKTIDRDLAGTEYSLGYDTALNVICESAERVAHTAASHQTLTLLEVMGRHAGWLALRGGEAAFADIVLIPEYACTLEQLSEVLRRKLRESEQQGFEQIYKIIVVSEGAHLLGEETVRQDAELDEFGHYQLGGIGNHLQTLLTKEFRKVRCTTLSYLQRGAPPTQKDRQMGRRFGHSAVELLASGISGCYVAMQRSRLTRVDLPEIRKSPQLVDVARDYDTDNLNVRFGTAELEE